MNGSISWSGTIENRSQCDTEEPLFTGLGANICGRPEASFPPFNTTAASFTTCGPFHTRWPVLTAEATRSASVICGQVLFVVLSNRNRSKMEGEGTPF